MSKIVRSGIRSFHTKIPFTIRLFYTIYQIIHRMLQASSQRRLMTSTFTIQRKKDFKSATTLLCIAILFIACQSPKIIPDVYEAWNCSYIQVLFGI